MSRYILVLAVFILCSQSVEASLCQSYFQVRSKVEILEEKTLEAFEKAREESEIQIYTDQPLETLFSEHVMREILEHKNKKFLRVTAHVDSFTGQANVAFVDTFQKDQLPFENKMYITYERNPRFQSSGFLSKRDRQRNWYKIPGTYVRLHNTFSFNFEQNTENSFFRSRPSSHLF